MTADVVTNASKKNDSSPRRSVQNIILEGAALNITP